MQSPQHLISSIFSKQSAATAVCDALKNRGFPESQMRIGHVLSALPRRVTAPLSLPLFENVLPWSGIGSIRGIWLASLEKLYHWLHVRIGKTHIKLSVTTYSDEETSIVSEVMQASVQFYCDQRTMTSGSYR